MGRDSATSLAPGFRFHPTDEELVSYYLKRKVRGKTFLCDAIAVIDIYKSEPWDLPCQSKLKSRDLEWYFFSGLDKKYGNGSKTNRATEKGYWKTTGKDRPVRHKSRIVGMKKTLVYHDGRAPRGARTNWVMHEYRMTDDELVKAGIAQDAFVLCRVFQKSGTGPKNGEQYGAPFIEEEWEEDEVAPVSAERAITDVVLMGDDVGFLETNDLEQHLGTDIASSSAAIPLSICYGESSSYPEPEHSQETTEEQKPLAITGGTCEPQEDRFLNIPEQYAVDGKTLKDEYEAEATHDGSPLNVDNVFDDPCWDAIDFPQIGDGSFLETNDLLNPIEADLDVNDMLDEYLNYIGTDIASSSAAIPLSICYGESSSYPEPQHCRETTEEQRPLAITGGTCEPQEDWFLNIPEQYAVDGKTLKDEYEAEATHDGSPLNVDNVFDDPCWDAIDFPQIADGSFLETNDLLNPIEADLDVNDMLDEYLNYFDADDDISNFISSEDPQIKSDAEVIPDQGLPFTQNVDEEPNMACEQNFDEAPCSDGASSSKKNPELSKSVQGDMNPLTKRVSRLLDGIPAPPAFASEFPPKDIALRLHSAAQSSNHVTAGMIRVTDIALRGNGMDWMLGKNGGFDFVISSDFSQPNNISDALVPVSGLLSGKSAFLVSHCWIFLMLFSVLILSLSCKIGSCMYAAGK
ncbi:hypothetical protein QN277_011354 [Acacia crassicarpa]|uniref:NAC domain-containing protein n=1 Tax=Acacia crassicarpa TaxID=499986 RepID=A0AAE1TBH7_9FABA|nr:hypothetical protein QN277_011354 [Acacia crassicarpa]